MRYDLVDLRLFVAIADEENVSRGAARSHLSPSSASLRIKGLEQAVGTDLMVRNPRGITLTPPGRIVKEHSRRILAQLEQMHSDLQPYSSGLMGHVTCFANSNAISSHLPRDLARFFELNPTVRVTLEERTSHDIVLAVAEGRADLGIVAVDTGHEVLTYLPYKQDQLVLLASLHSDLAKLDRIRFSECLNHPFISLQPGAVLHTFLMNQAIELGGRLNVRVQVSGLRAIIQLVSSGAGVGIVPRSTLEPGDRERVAVIDVDEPWAFRDLRVCFQPNERLVNVHARKLIETLCGLIPQQ